MNQGRARPPVLVRVMAVLVLGLLAGGFTWRVVEQGHADTLPGIAIVLLGAMLPVAIGLSAVWRASRKRPKDRD